ncbi:MAG: hypothetical protein J5748_05075 [Bacteroidales bacterium]|nr:hypothetical protein [Bacteroidales bacterium]
MKKYFIIAAAAVVAMAACSKDQIVDNGPGSKVTFQAANYVRATKAGEPVSVFNDFKTFKCRAFLHAEGVDLNADYSVKTDSYQEFFGASGETISPYDSDNAVIANPTTATTNVHHWAPSHEYYWPKSEHSFVNFVGWYGTNGTSAVDPTIAYAYNTTTSKWTATMTWSWGGTTVGAAGSNLLYADMAWRYNENPSAEYGLNGLSSGYNKGVPMLFHHALAQINVKAYASAATAGSGEPANAALTAGSGTVSDGTATWTIVLDNVKITPVYATGTLALTNADPGSTEAQAWTGSWTGSGTAGDLATDSFTVQKVTKATAEDVYEATCVLPQTLGATVVLSFDLDITTAYSGSVSNHEIIPISIKLNDMGTTEWAMNTKYTYYLQINPSQKRVRFDPALEADWSEVELDEHTI